MGTLSAGGIAISCTVTGFGNGPTQAGVSAAYYNVSQTTPLDTNAETVDSSGSGTAVSDATNSSYKLNNGYVVYDVVVDDSTAAGIAPPTATVGSGQNAYGTDVTSATTPYNHRISSSDSQVSPNGGTAPATTTMAWTLGSTTNWSHLLLPLTPQNPGQASTAVRDTVVRVERDETGNLVKWRTGYEVRNLGFNVYRGEPGAWVRLNPSPDRRLRSPGRPQRNLDRGQQLSLVGSRRPGGALYWVESIDLSGAAGIARAGPGKRPVAVPRGERVVPTAQPRRLPTP